MSSQEQVQRAAQVQAKYTNTLMQKPHVVGVAVGYPTVNGVRSPDVGVVVMVDRKVPLTELRSEDTIPTILDGVRVDVQETGAFSAQ